MATVAITGRGDKGLGKHLHDLAKKHCRIDDDAMITEIVITSRSEGCIMFNVEFIAQNEREEK